MKRFFLIVSVTVCSLFILSPIASAKWAVEWDSKVVSQGQTGVVVNLTAYWDIKMGSFSTPVIVRGDGSGAFWVPPLPVDTTGGPVVGVAWNWSNPGWALLVEDVRPGLLGCNPAGDTGYDGVSPDHFVINAAGVGGDTPAEPNGRNVVILTIDVNNTIGHFYIDTACYTSSLNTIYMIDNVGFADHGPTGVGDFSNFNLGDIEIQANQCPSNPGSYANVAGNELALMQNAWNGAAYQDNESDAPQFCLISGPGVVDLNTGAWSWTPLCGAASQMVTIQVSDVPHGCAPCTQSQISFMATVNAFPVGIQCPADQSTLWGGTINAVVTATTPCTPVTFIQTGGPGSTTTGGAYTWNTTCADVGGPYTVTVVATDNAQRTAQCTFQVTVTNNPPVCNIVNPPPFLFSLGHHQDLALEVSGGNGPLKFFGLNVVPPPAGNPPTLSVAGMLDWDPIDPVDAPGVYLFTFGVTDDCDTVYCEKYIELLFAQPYKLSIVRHDLEDGLLEVPLPEDHMEYVFNGQKASVGVYMQFGFTEGTGAFDILVCYDCSALTFLEAEKGSGIADWEYFTYRFGPFGNNCGTGCPSCYIRLIGIRDMNNGQTPPVGSENVAGKIAMLTFRVTEDRSFIGMCARVGFCAIDCGDNVIACVAGSHVAVPFPFAGAHFYHPNPKGTGVGGWSGLDFEEQTDPTGIYFKPDYWWVDPIDFVLAKVDANCNGYFVPKVFDDPDTWHLVDYWTPVCWTGELTDEDCPIEGKEPPTPYILFDEGHICIKPPPDARGDMNLNGIANEVGDAVLYSNYFIYGQYYCPWYCDGLSETRLLASDINDDGIVGTVADLVYLIRIITGDAQPFPESGEGDFDPKLSPYAAALNINSEVADGQMTITASSASDIGAGHLVFRYTGLTVGSPETNTDMTVKGSAADGTLRVLVFSMKGNSIDAGVTELVSIPIEGNGTIELTDASFSDASGALMTVDMHRVAPPAAFELMQNYPNPFNASTMLRFALPVASDWSMKIYNIAGQVVESFAGSADAGYVSITWNADVASGIYFYKLTAGDFTATKKMVLMK